ncbi:hypothetical protein AMELA_G00043180 [Ameiurus melas]|uniref:Uncharacterized protein n=1 Tax=Ameiurus melas TaxID=219545 RepID=A0A7J6B448_AMEME|nr:hypothetical protein AMELA_G00043180 [Ameiurus melas]
MRISCEARDYHAVLDVLAFAASCRAVENGEKPERVMIRKVPPRPPRSRVCGNVGDALVLTTALLFKLGVCDQ